MKEARRIVLISRRYWPLVGGAERVMAGLAAQFQAEGREIQLLTARWESHWPEELVHREVPVKRLANPKTRGWGTFRYMHALKRWLRSNAEQYDAALVSMLKHDAHVTIKTLNQLNKPTLIRAEGAGPTGDCEFHKTARFGSRIKKSCMNADGIVAPSQVVEQELIKSGFSSEQVQFIPNGVEISDKAPILKTDARRSLSEAHPILTIDPGEPLVVYTGRLDVQKGLLDLVDAWQKVAETFPRGRLWLVGEGNDGRLIWDRIRESRLTTEIVMPGSFDDVSDLLRAADVFVLPSYQEGMSLSLLEAMASDVPVVASDIPPNRALVENDKGILFPPKDSEALANSLLDSIQKQKISREYANNARRFVLEKYSLNKMASSHLELIDSAIRKRNP